MSFIYDKDIYEKIIKSAQQMALVPHPMLPLAQKLSNRLSRELSGQSELPNIIVKKDSTNPTIGDIDINKINNLDNLLKYLDESKLEIDNERVVEKSAGTLPEKIKTNRLGKKTVNMGRDNGRIKTGEYWINAPALDKFVNELLRRSREKNDPKSQLFEAIISTIINQMNKYKGDINSEIKIVEKAKPGEIKKTELSDTTVLDFFSRKRFNKNNLLEDMDFSTPDNITNVTVLTVKDLSSRENLNAWLQKSPPAEVSNEEGKFIPYSTYETRTIDSCIIMQVLYARASHRQKRADSPDIRKLADFYLKRVRELASTFGDGGKACPLDSKSTTTPSTEDKTDKAKGTTISDSEKKQQQNALLLQMSSPDIFPFQQDSIIFKKIRDFYNLYREIIGLDTDTAIEAEIYGYVQNIENSINEFSNYTIGAMTIIPLTGEYTDIANSFRSTEGSTNALNVVNILSDILMHAHLILIHFKTNYEKRLLSINKNISNLLTAQESIYTHKIKRGLSTNR